MKKIIYSLALMFILTACSMNDVIALIITPTIPPPPPPTQATFEPARSATPDQIQTSTVKPTFTSTPTLIGAGDTSEEIPTGETTVLPTLILVPTATSGPQISFNQTGSIILSISVSSDTLFWGYCEAPKYVDFDVRVANNPRLVYVLLFLRLVDKGGNQSTAWGVGAIMNEAGENIYTYHITPEHLMHYEEFKDAWIEYQVVASRGGARILESSPVYETSLSLQHCQPAEAGE